MAAGKFGLISAAGSTAGAGKVRFRSHPSGSGTGAFESSWSWAAEGQFLTTSTPAVARFLEDWFALHGDNWRPNTRRNYRIAIDRYLVKAFGPVRLEQLSPLMMQGWLTEHKTEHGARRRITYAHAVLRSALSEARRLQLVSLNAAEFVTVWKPAKKGVSALSLEQATAFLTVAKSHRLGALFSVALACGLRLGEARACDGTTSA